MLVVSQPVPAKIKSRHCNRTFLLHFSPSRDDLLEGQEGRLPVMASPFGNEPSPKGK